MQDITQKRDNSLAFTLLAVCETLNKIMATHCIMEIASKVSVIQLSYHLLYFLQRIHCPCPLISDDRAIQIVTSTP